MAPPTTATVSDFRAHTREHFSRLKKTAGAEILTMDGKPEGVVLSMKSYERMAQMEENMKTLAMIQASQREYAAGRGKSAKDAIRKLARKHGVAL